jgi:hypothetical protein
MGEEVRERKRERSSYVESWLVSWSVSRSSYCLSLVAVRVILCGGMGKNEEKRRHLMNISVHTSVSKARNALASDGKYQK